MGARTVTTRHSDIFRYWRFKTICKDGRLSDQIEDDSIFAVPEAWERPCCWACGNDLRESYYDDFERKYHRPENEQTVYEEYDYTKMYNDERYKHSVERCHIIPHAMGGPDKPENIFLMCPACHAASPDTDDPRSFFRWVYKQRKNTWHGWTRPDKLAIQMIKEVVDRGYTAKQIAEVVNTADWRREWEEYKQNHMGAHGAHISEATLVMCMADCVEGLILMQ